MPTVKVSTVLEGPIRQIGYIVRDLDAAMRSWCALGVGPWYTVRDFHMERCRYRGELCEPTMSVAFANSGPMQIELLQQHDDGPSIFREFLDAHGEGYNQLSWWATDFDAVLGRAEAAGWRLVFSNMDAEIRFALYELDTKISPVVEVTELTDLNRGLFDMVRDAALDWDGVTEPVRSVPL
jgi:hypothetical protein